MSRNRVKNIAYDHDDFASDDDNDSNDMTPEDREQMQQGSAQVRQLLDTDTPPVPASDEEIWEALWYYYYDVEKVVGFLRKKYTPKTPKKQQQQQQVKVKEPSPDDIVIKARESAKGLFSIRTVAANTR
ncbi:elongation factor Tu GTP binding domain-containing protein [Histoplasma capsulatum G186AR]|uniref:Elongation factor Tu GTP binding domain-containing protein n=1 Tax=Ajellomyces capsulatus TaxID=5037 RepID=A0A8H7Z2Y1_AJECA|nr:elongation factor Tu GTP binding domain-containing protein [Histoplasma capsulatum]QSS67207.1 elongation factor Tu GTP binding domain-containing protein [Histoplasma capsulatum G186AR]